MQAQLQYVIAKGFELMHVILAFGSRRLDQFDVFMSPRATVNSQLVYATDGHREKFQNPMQPWVFLNKKSSWN